MLQVIRHVLPIRQDITYSFCFTGAETEIHKIKDDGKLREKRTSIAAVRAKLGQFDTFQTPLLSHCRLPLILPANEYFVTERAAIMSVDVTTTTFMNSFYIWSEAVDHKVRTYI